MKLLALITLALIPTLFVSTSAQADDAQAPLVLAGSESRSALIAGLGEHSWDLFLPADENTHIVVDGDGDSDLDAYLFDENGNLVASDDDYTDYCILDVNPIWTGAFTLVVVNRGDTPNLYELRVD